MTWLREFWQDCHGGLSPSIAIIMMYLFTDCRIDITKSVGFNNMILITTKGGQASIEARQGWKLESKNTACSSFVATVFMTKGGISASNAIK